MEAAQQDLRCLSSRTLSTHIRDETLLRFYRTLPPYYVIYPHPFTTANCISSTVCFHDRRFTTLTKLRYDAFTPYRQPFHFKGADILDIDSAGVDSSTMWCRRRLRFGHRHLPARCDQDQAASTRRLCQQERRSFYKLATCPLQRNGRHSSDNMARGGIARHVQRPGPNAAWLSAYLGGISVSLRRYTGVLV